MGEKSTVPEDESSIRTPDNPSTLVDLSHNESRQDTMSDINKQNEQRQKGDSSCSYGKSKPHKVIGTLTTEGSEQLYSVLSSRYKAFIICIGALISSFTQVTSFSHLPAATSIREEFDTTVTMVNSLVGTCMIGFIGGSMLLGPISDRWGRRPAMIFVCAIYIGGSIGASRAPSMATLLAMRAVQGVGISATLCISDGIMSDIIVPSKRGRYMAVYNIARLTMPLTFTLISGAISETIGWRWIFSVFALIVFAFLVLFILFVPETLRALVGNGSGHDTAPIFNCLNNEKTDINETDKIKNDTEASSLRSRFCYVPNPSASLRFLLYPDALCIQLLNCFSATNMTMMTASSTLFADYYGLNDLQVALTFIGREAGLLLGPVIMGPLLDRYYARYVKDFQEKHIRDEKGTGVEDNTIASDFPLFRARLSHNWWNVIVNELSIAGFGWCIAKKVHISAPIILQSICAFNNYNVYSSVSVLLIDLFPGQAASISACASVTRSIIILIYTETVGPGIDHLGVGICFTVYALVLVVVSCLIPILIIFGPRWRLKRLQQEK